MWGPRPPASSSIIRVSTTEPWRCQVARTCIELWFDVFSLVSGISAAGWRLSSFAAAYCQDLPQRRMHISHPGGEDTPHGQALHDYDETSSCVDISLRDSCSSGRALVRRK